MTIGELRDAERVARLAYLAASEALHAALDAIDDESDEGWTDDEWERERGD
jgi:hypothetical protein